MASIGSVTSRPGASTPSPYMRGGLCEERQRIEAESREHQSASSVAPPSSSTALTICTQVVAIIPPNST